MFGKVAVLMGGHSAEREISLQSGQAVVQALQSQNIEAQGIDAVDDFIQTLIAGQFDRVFIALHGRGGEDGSVQGLLENLKLPYTGSGILGSALCIDKRRSKRFWQAMGLATPPFMTVEPGQDPGNAVKSLGLPLCVKPVYEGSSVGVKRVDDFFDIYDACKDSAQYGSLMIEKWITGEEYSVGILDNRALSPIKVSVPDGFYDFNAKYLSSETEYLCPAPLSEAETKGLQSLSLEAFWALGGSGWGRVDFIRDEKGDFWLLEVNTIPGLTDHSLIPKIALAEGLTFEKLVVQILSQTLTPRAHLLNIGKLHTQS